MIRMKAKAKHWIKYNGKWHGAGEAFEIEDADAEEMKRTCEVIEDAEKPVTETEEPVKRTRKRKAEEETV